MTVERIPEIRSYSAEVRDALKEMMNDTKKYRYLIMKANKVYEDYEVDLAQTGGPTSTYDDFLEGLPDDDCRWALYDWDPSRHGDDSQIIFFSWIANGADDLTRAAFEEGRNYDEEEDTNDDRIKEAIDRASRNGSIAYFYIGRERSDVAYEKVRDWMTG